MAKFEHAGATIYYDLEGNDAGPPVLLIAPGGLRSENAKWNSMAYNPRSALASEFRLIGMDQRNAGRSVGPVDPVGWAAYTADQLALLDELDIEKCSVIGMCIGGPYILALLKAAPERFDKAVLLQPVGLTEENRPLFDNATAAWVNERQLTDDAATLEAFRQAMWHQPFVGSVSEADVVNIDHQMLVMMGNDVFHPEATSRRIVELAAGATLVEDWKGDAVIDATSATIADFLHG